MIKAAVLGAPISHSLSPKIHNKAYEILGITANYTAIELDQESFLDFFRNNTERDWNGFSLTMPLKEVAFEICDDVSDIARQINSANTLYKVEDKWRLTSTDYLAFLNLLQVGPESKVAIIGGGGTARAAAGALNEKITNLDLILRTPDRLSGMKKAAPRIDIRALDMDAPLENYDLIIQTTPSGAYDGFVPNLNAANGVLLECLYKPWPTPLAQRYQQLGGNIISGKELLVEQALFQIEFFSGIRFEFANMRRELLQHISTL